MAAHAVQITIAPHQESESITICLNVEIKRRDLLTAGSFYAQPEGITVGFPKPFEKKVMTIKFIKERDETMDSNEVCLQFRMGHDKAFHLVKVFYNGKETSYSTVDGIVSGCIRFGQNEDKGTLEFGFKTGAHLIVKGP